jgi:hypothetical protein
MVKMNLHSESEDPQIQRLNEFFLVADKIRKVGRSVRQGLGKFKKSSPNGGGARLSALASNENPLFTNGSFVLPKQGSREAPSASSFPPPGNPLGKEGVSAIQASKTLAALNTQTECQLSGKNAQAISARSDGGECEGHPQRSPSALVHQGIPSRAQTSAAEAPGESSHTQVLTKHPFPLPHISESLSTIVGQRPKAGYLSVVATRQVTREDASAARVKASSGKTETRRNLIAPTTAPPTRI